MFKAVFLRSTFLKKLVYSFIIFLFTVLPADSQWEMEFHPNCNLHPELCPPSAEDVKKMSSGFGNKVSSQNPKASTSEYAVIKMRVIQEMKNNPKIYWAFEFAGKGPDGWNFFERSEKKGRLRKDILRFIGGVGVSYGNVSISLPDISEMEAFKDSQKLREFFEFHPELPNLSERATEVTDMLFSVCEDETFSCQEFQDRFSGHDVGSLAKALQYAQVQSFTWPIGTDREYLSSQFPAEANFVESIQNAKTFEESLEVIQENTSIITEQQGDLKADIQNSRVAHILQNDPIFHQEDAVLLELSNKQKIYNNQLENINKQLSQVHSDETLSEEKIKDLYREKERYGKAIKGAEKAKEIYKHKKFCRQAGGWVEAGTAVAVTLGAPEEVIKLGQAASFGVNIYEAGMSMILAGALDPTGITAIAKGVGGIMNLVLGIPSTEQVMMEKLNEILNNQKEMLANQKQILANQRKILNRLGEMEDKLLSRLDEMENMLSMNHREIVQNQEGIKEILSNIRSDMLYGFESLSRKMDENRYKELILGAQNLYGPYFEQKGTPDQKEFMFCQMKREYCSEKAKNQFFGAEDHIRAMANFSKREVVSFDPNKKIDESNNYKESSKLQLENLINVFHINSGKSDAFLKQKEKSDTKKYLHNPVRYRVKMLNSMIKWVNFQLDKHEKRLKSDVDNIFTQHSQEKNKFSISLQKLKLPEIPINNIIAYPSFQDELFFEAVNLSMVLHEEYDIENDRLVKNENIDRICMQSRTIEDTAHTMRKYIPTAWKVYLLSQMNLKDLLIKSFGKHRRKLDTLNIKIKLNSIEEISRFKVYATPHSGPYYHYHNENKPIKSKCDGRFEYIGYSGSDNYKKFFNEMNYDNKAFSRLFHPKDRQLFIGFGLFLRSDIISNYVEEYEKIVNRNIKDMFTEHQVNVAIISWGYWKGTKIVDTHRSVPTSCKTDWEGVETCDYKCIKLAKPIYKTVLVPDRESFLNDHKEVIRKKLKDFYNTLIKDLNNSNAILEWMKARLVLDTMVKIGYGDFLYTHPKLFFLDNLINNLPARNESEFTAYLKDNLNQAGLIEYEKEYASELKSVVQFLDDIEQAGYLKAQWIHSLAKLAASKNLGSWVPKGFRPKCETKESRVQSLISNARKTIQFLERNKDQLKQQTRDWQNRKNILMIRDYNTDPITTKISEINSRADNINSAVLHLRNILGKAVNDGEVTNFERDWIREFLAEQDIKFLDYQKWGDKPFCENLYKNLGMMIAELHNQLLTKDEVKSSKGFSDSEKKNNEIRKLIREVLKNGDLLKLLPVLPLPLEETWKGLPVGFGLPELRHEAFRKASLYEHLRPEKCLLNVQ